MEERFNVVGLLSGGKDSCYNLCHCAAQGHTIVALATLSPPQGKDELDSYMYQTVGHDAIHLIAEAMDLPLYRTTIAGKPLNQTSSYGDRLPAVTQAGPSTAVEHDEHDETEDLVTLLLQVKRAHPEVNAVSVGAILSNYQRVRVEHVALRLNLQLMPLAFLWQRNQAQLLDEMCRADVRAILIKVAGAGLGRRDLGQTLHQMRDKLHRLHATYGAHICGEGGEYETLTLDCPMFKRTIVLDKMTVVEHGESSSDPVFYLKIDAAHLEDKPQTNIRALKQVTIPAPLDPWSQRALEQICSSTSPVPSTRKGGSTSGSSAVVSRQGRWLMIGGVEGKSCKGADGSGMDPVELGMEAAFAQLHDMLLDAGLSMANLTHLNVYLAHQSHFTTLNKVYRTLFGVDPPSRACVAIDLGTSPIRLDAIAFVSDGEPTQPPAYRRALHVQGRSYWAAANIGPYSQAVETAGRTSIAGQIGLDAVTLQLVAESNRQVVLALQHARRIMKANLEEVRVTRRQGWVEGVLCWLADARYLPAAQDVWRYQEDGAAEEDEAEQGEVAWEANWCGHSLSHDQVPILYIGLDQQGLPRGAAVEWQLSAHNGDVVVTQDEEDEPASYATPTCQQGQGRCGPWLVRWTILTSPLGATEFGIASIHANQDDNDVDLDPVLLRIFQGTGVHVRIPYVEEEARLRLAEILAKIPGGTHCAITYLPVHHLFDHAGNAIEAAIVWQAGRALSMA